MTMTGPDAILSSSISIPNEEWNDINLDMNENDFDVLQHEVFEVTSSDFFEMDFLPSNGENQDKNDLFHLVQNDLEEEMSIDGLSQASHHPESERASPTSTSKHFIECSSSTGTDVSLHIAQLPFLTSAELEQRMKQSVSRLTLSMKRSEMSRQRYLENGGGCHSAMFPTFASTCTSVSESRKAIGSYMSRVGSSAL